MKKILLILSLFMLLCVPAPSVAGQGAKAEVRHADVKLADITVLGLTPGVSTKTDVEERLGPGEAENAVSGRRGYTRFCYVSSKAGDFTKLVFEFPSSLVPDSAVVAGIKIYAGDVRYGGEKRCVGSKLVDSGTATYSGIGPGATPAQLKAVLGEPASERNAFIGYEYHTLKRLTGPEVERLKAHWPFVLKYPYVDIYSSIEARFYNGVLKRLDLARIVARP